MNSKPLVSIITPFFNAEKFFQEAIESVLAQTYDNWELLLVDDGSIDNSTAIALDYAQKYSSQIHYLKHPNRRNCGKSSSRNLGISNARGKYISLLDADDVYLPEKLAKQVVIMETHPEAGMVYGATRYWYSWNNSENQDRDWTPELGVQPDRIYYPPLLLTRYLQNGDIVPCPCGLLLRQQVVKNLGGFDRSIQQLYEDQVLLAKICINAPVFVESGSWDRYRQHDDSSWHLSLKTGQEAAARLIYLNWLKKYLTEQEISEPELWKALQNQLFPYHYPRLYRITQLPQHLLRYINKLVKLILK